jgi:hypothetical protein
MARISASLEKSRWERALSPSGPMFSLIMAGAASVALSINGHEVGHDLLAYDGGYALIILDDSYLVVVPEEI